MVSRLRAGEEAANLGPTGVHGAGPRVAESPDGWRGSCWRRRTPRRPAMSPRFRLPTFTRSSRPDSRVAIASLFLALACHSNERSPRDGSGDGAVEDPAAHPAPDGSAPDAGPDTGRPDVMPVSADLQPDADPLANVEICEPQA